MKKFMKIFRPFAAPGERVFKFKKRHMGISTMVVHYIKNSMIDGSEKWVNKLPIKVPRSHSHGLLLLGRIKELVEMT